MNDKSLKITLIVAALVVTGGLCALFYTMEEEKTQLSEQSFQLEKELAARDSAYNQIISIMYSVESKIEQIKDREHLISDLSVGEVNQMDKMQLSKDLNMIDSLILETNDKVANLSSRLDQASFNLKSFKNKVKDLTKELEERKLSMIALKEDLNAKDVQIVELTTNVNSLNEKVESQNSTIDIQRKKIDLQEEQMHKAYMAIGTEKILQEEGLVVREGGFLGIGKITDINNQMPQEKFDEIDIRTTTSLEVDSKKVSLITEHPPHSYELVKDGDKIKSIKITNPEEFWKISKYLVVAVNS
ncbi:Cbp1 family collagen-binding glycoprotein adhesin [Reichenbachiella ulvae]|uniref:Chromosome partition protein Smc n=1 Tax=Reichenbachiella ulvae TaxID=2980104 RepID=A0ABT3CWM2_9BACT|nr:hypothetical protein [Reichenbachiella ulvae]MCV9387997.1 hypothetical protein [Reichenbachiella ulvae]